MNNPFAKLDVVKYAGKVVALDEAGNVIATAKERRSLKYDKNKYKNPFIVTLPPVTQNITKVAFVIDKSGSMWNIRNDVIKNFRELIDSANKLSIEHNQQTYFSLFLFSSRPLPIKVNVDYTQIELNSSIYTCSGNTALFDAVDDAITKIKSSEDTNSTSYLIYVLTDGYENASLLNSRQFSEIIKKCNDDERYTIVFCVPPGSKNVLCSTYNISNDNVREWENTSIGIKNNTEFTTSGFSNYYQARSTGATRTTKFFVNADLSKVKSKDLDALEDISKYVKIMDVNKESPIKEFIEEKTKRPYIIGSAFYRLDKTELVQSTKRIIIYDKDTKSIYGGTQARDIIGLPLFNDAKLSPYNVSKYEVFVESTSVNRKLPRGTKVLLDKRVTSNKTPTWGQA